MKILLLMLLVLFLIGLGVIVLPIVFPAFCFKIFGKFLDWKMRSGNTWNDS